MIRRTQARTIRLIESKLNNEGYAVVYTDEPGSSRSGPGITGEINLVFEHLYDRTPDIVAITTEADVLLVEVDGVFKTHLPDKYLQYERKSDQLITRLEEIVNQNLTNLRFGFGTTKAEFPSLDLDRSPFHKFYIPDVDTVVHKID